jgi:uncharacterized surface protein with fasciclin (FAS1) repeats
MTSNAPNSQAQNYTFLFEKQNYRTACKPIKPNKNSLLDIINNSPDLTVFKNIVRVGNYQEILDSSQSNFTIFVPSDKAILGTTNGMRDRDNIISGDIDTGLAYSVLKASILNNKITSELLEYSPFTYLIPIDKTNRLFIKNINGLTIINNNITVLVKDIICENGIIHVIDDIIIPRSFI